MLEGTGTFTVDGEAVTVGRRGLPPRRRRCEAAGGRRTGRDDVHRHRRQAKPSTTAANPCDGSHRTASCSGRCAAGSEPAARAFYGGLLGLEEIEKPLLLAVRGGCWFSLGNGELHVGVEDPFRPAAKAHPALLVESTEALETLAASLEAEGVDRYLGRRGRDPGPAPVLRQ